MQIWLFLYHAKKKKKTGSDGKKRLLTFFCNSGDLKKNVLRLSLLSNWSTNIIDIALPVIVWMGWNQINRQEFHVVHLKEAVSDQFKDCTVLFICRPKSIPYLEFPRWKDQSCECSWFQKWHSNHSHTWWCCSQHYQWNRAQCGWEK